LRDRLALLQRHSDRHFLHPFAREPRRFEDDVGALGGRGMAPDSQPVLRRRQSGIGSIFIAGDMDTLYVSVYNDMSSFELHALRHGSSYTRGRDGMAIGKRAGLTC
jgi:hypothetical protein